jgi:hypothetical protein
MRIRIRTKVKSRIHKRFNPLGDVELTIEPWRLLELRWLTKEPRRLIVEPWKVFRPVTDTQHRSRIQSRIRINAKGRIRILIKVKSQIGIRIKVKSWIRIKGAQA